MNHSPKQNLKQYHTMKTNKKATSSIINAIGTLILAAAVCISVPATTNAATAKKSTAAATKSTKSTKTASKAAIDTKFAPQIASAKKLTSKMTPTQRTKLLTLLNTGEAEALVKISGIGTTRAKAIAAARPFESVETLTIVNGIGDLTLSKIIAHSKSAK